MYVQTTVRRLQREAHINRRATRARVVSHPQRSPKRDRARVPTKKTRRERPDEERQNLALPKDIPQTAVVFPTALL